MRSSKNRSRSKSNNRQRSIGNIINRVFDSSGPESKVRGTPQQIIEKYLQLARDAQLGNDRVAEQNFLQHAEHYTRMLGEAQREMQKEQEFRQSQGGDRPPHQNGSRDRDDDQPATSGSYGEPQPNPYYEEEAAIVETPEMRVRTDGDQRREPRRDQNRDHQRDQNRNDQNRNDHNRNDHNRNDSGRNDQPRRDGERSEQNRSDQSRSEANRNDANRHDQNRGEANRNDQNRNDQNRNDAGRNDPGRGEPNRGDQPRRDQRTNRPRPEQARPQITEAQQAAPDETAADIPLPAFVAAPLRVADVADAPAAAEKPKSRRKPKAVSAEGEPASAEPNASAAE